jgi:ADP-heptose:LPS heptosyltransferase
MVKYFAKIWLNRLIHKEKGTARAAIQPGSIASLLFVELTKFGDVVTILPLLQSFHDAFPQASITVAVQPQFAGIFSFLSFPVEVIALQNTQSLNGFLVSRSKIKETQYDLAVSASPGIRNGILTLSTKAKAKIGYFEVLNSVTPFLHNSSVQGFGITLKREETYGRENIALRARKICSSLGIAWNDKISFAVPDALKDTVRTQLGLHSEKPVVAVHPFAGWKYREWKFASFLSVMQQLTANSAVDVVVIGMQAELERVLQKQPLPGGIKIFDVSKIPELLALYRIAALYIGNDSGPLHLASMACVPCVGLFGPASPELTAPVGKDNAYCYHKLECSPCSQQRCVRPEHPCMELITQEEVLNAALKLLPVNAR